MVLADVGRRISAALSDLGKSNAVDDKALDAAIKEVCSALLSADVNVKLVGQLRQKIQATIGKTPAQNKRKLAQKAIFDQLVALVDPGVAPWKPNKGRSNVIMFVGLQGSGKTTSCTKLAAYYQKRGYKTGLVCADTFRAGAFDQLKQNASKAKIPFFGSYTETDPVTIADEGVVRFKKEKFEIIIVDTSGRHRQEKELFQEMRMISSAVKPDQTIMVLDASIGQAAESQSVAFKEAADFGAIIVTKLDGHARGGGAISAVAATKTPIVFIGTGEHIHDLEAFVPLPFIQKMLGMGDLTGLAEAVQNLKLDPEQNKEMIARMKEGIFTVRDMRDQLQNIMKMGPLSKLAGMLPGMSQDVVSGLDADGGRGMRRLIHICDSMSLKDGKVFKTQQHRLLRVARGSGTSVREVEDLLNQHAMMSKMVKKMGGKNGFLQKMAAARAGGGGPGGPGAVGPGGMPGNGMPSLAQIREMQKAMPPGMLENMRKQFMGGGGGGAGPGGPGGMDMSKMMEMMQNMGGMGGLGSMFGR